MVNAPFDIELLTKTTNVSLLSGSATMLATDHHLRMVPAQQFPLRNFFTADVHQLLVWITHERFNN